MRISAGRALPLAVKIPLLVACLMVAVGVVASERVLARLQEAQERQLADLKDAYLDGLSSSLVDPVLRADPWEVFDILDRASGLYAAVRPLDTIVLDGAGKVLAASDPRRHPIGSDPPRGPAGAAVDDALVDEESGRAYAGRVLVVEGREVGSILVAIDAAPILEERRQVMWTLLVSNGAVTLGAAALGWFAVRRMVSPLNILNGRLERALDGRAEPIPDEDIAGANTETGRLFRSYNALARGLAERDALLAKAAEEERLASLGRLASGMAHEINNPLGGLFNALDTLKVHGEREDVRRSTIDLLDRGLRGIRDVVRSTLATWRADREPRAFRQADLDDLALLIRPEVARKAVDLEVAGRLEGEVPVDAIRLRQVLLNLALNACRAVPEGGAVRISLVADRDALAATVDDSGPGLPEEADRILAGTAGAGADRGGLGLAITSRMIRDLGGTVTAGRSPLGGASIRVTIPLRHRPDLEARDVA